MSASEPIFDRHLDLWNLVPEGKPTVTHRARLLSVRCSHGAAMLKVATDPDETYGGLLLQWWDGRGAARLFAMDGNALLIERAEGHRSLAALARGGRDDEARQIMCDVIAELHEPRGQPPPGLVPLAAWFRELEPAAASHGGLLARSAESARLLLANPQNVGVLHGDVHHENILDFGERGWLAIDPSGSMESVALTTPSCSATRISAIRGLRWPRCPIALPDASKSWSSEAASTAAASSTGSSPGPACQQPGS